jgi:hypothetical protein
MALHGLEPIHYSAADTAAAAAAADTAAAAAAAAAADTAATDTGTAATAASCKAVDSALGECEHCTGTMFGMAGRAADGRLPPLEYLLAFNGLKPIYYSDK